MNPITCHTGRDSRLIISYFREFDHAKTGTWTKGSDGYLSPHFNNHRIIVKYFVSILLLETGQDNRAPRNAAVALHPPRGVLEQAQRCHVEYSILIVFTFFFSKVESTTLSKSVRVKDIHWTSTLSNTEISSFCTSSGRPQCPSHRQPISGHGIYIHWTSTKSFFGTSIFCASICHTSHVQYVNGHRTWTRYARPIDTFCFYGHDLVAEVYLGVDPCDSPPSNVELVSIRGNYIYSY